MFVYKTFSAVFFLLLVFHHFESSWAHPLSTGVLLKPNSPDFRKKPFGRKARRSLSVQDHLSHLTISLPSEEEEDFLPSSLSTLLDNLEKVEAKNEEIHSRPQRSSPRAKRSCGNVENRVKKIVAEQLDVSNSDVTLNATFEELGADSLNLVELILAVEEEFQMDIPDEDAEKLKSVSDLVNYVAKNC